MAGGIPLGISSKRRGASPTNRSMNLMNSHFLRQRRTKPIHINFNGIPTFRFNKYLMAISICKTIYFILNTWTIPRTCTFN